MIVGGTAAPDGKYPWQVRLYSNMDDTIGFCGGSIIAPQWVLTAGHCLIDSDAVVVGYGSNDRTKTKKIESEKIIVHPGYIAGEKADLALVKLKQPIPDAAAISFADAAKEQALIPAGATVTVTGWGAIWDFQAFQNAVDVMAGRKSVSEKKLLTNEELEAPRKLHEVDIEVIDPKECKAVYESLQVPDFVVGDTEIYMRGDRMLEMHRCKNCGCVMWWVPVDKNYDRMGINARMLPLGSWDTTPVKKCDGASW